MNAGFPNVRAATRADLALLVDYNAAMAWETEHKRLDRDVLTRGIGAVFDDPRRGFYLVAELSSAPVGALLVTCEWSDWRCGDWWWIQSVYVAEPHRRTGVFRQLYGAVETRARATAGVIGLRLYVEWENQRAQQTYTSLGMTQAHYHMYQRSFVGLD